jgi:hypothetical protein
VTWLRVGNSTEWITGWPGWIEAITVFKPGELLVLPVVANAKFSYLT